MPKSLYRDSDRPVGIMIRYRRGAVSTQKVCGTFGRDKCAGYYLNTAHLIPSKLYFIRLRHCSAISYNESCTMRIVQNVQLHFTPRYLRVGSTRGSGQDFCKFWRVFSVWVENMLENHFCLCENLCAYSNPNFHVKHAIVLPTFAPSHN